MLLESRADASRLTAPAIIPQERAEGPGVQKHDQPPPLKPCVAFQTVSPRNLRQSPALSTSCRFRVVFPHWMRVKYR